jgi:NSS family neurotransmitter:Na+ symporter
MRREETRDELTSLTAGNFAFWHVLIRYVVPPVLLVIFVQGIRG